ncbi:NYN domain-containing protein [bacterium]|nr:NYN domain-containing protein [bacterium]
MSTNRETNLALFIDFDNVALGARDARQRFDVKMLLGRILEKGKIIVKKAYADWHFYKEHMNSLHEAAIELIEIPMPKISGKNSADIKMVVDAMDLCYSKDHIDTFVIVSGDSDFSPLVSKLRENNKRVIGVGMKNSSSKLLIGNCDEFIFYDDLYRQSLGHGQVAKVSGNVPLEKRDLFDFLVSTAQSLLQESRGVLYSSLIKDTMTRKKPDFNERAYGYSTFGDLLEEARNLGLLVVERDARAGGTWVVQGIGTGLVPAEKAEPAEKPVERNGGRSSSRSSRRRRRGGKGSKEEGEASARTETSDDKAAGAGEAGAGKAEDQAGGGRPAGDAGKPQDSSPAGKAAAGPSAGSSAADQTRPAAEKTTGKAQDGKSAAKKTTAKKTTAKKTTAKKATTKKTTGEKTAAKDAPAKKTTTKKAATKKTTARKTTKKKTGTRTTGTGGDDSR